MKRYNIFELLEMIDDLDKIVIIENLSDNERKLLSHLADCDYQEATLPDLQKVTGIPYITLKRVVQKLDALGLVTTFRDAIKMVILNPALLQKKDIYKDVRRNLLRIQNLEERVTDLEQGKKKKIVLEATTD